MSREYSEDNLVQKATIDYFKYNLDWNTAYAYNQETFGEKGSFGRKSEKEVVLVRYLKQALKKFNPGLPDKVYEQAISKIVERDSSKSLMNINEEKYKLFKNGVEVEIENSKGEREKKKLRVFNFNKDEVSENHFLAIREMWIQGNLYRRRADIIGFINGIPLLFMELKNVHKNVKRAYSENLTDYKDTIPHLFNHNALTMLSNGSECKVGAVTSEYEYYHDWKRLDEDDESAVEFETMLKGICNKENFMDIFENFILYDDSGAKKAKIIAQNHQYIGVNRAIDSFNQAKVAKGNKLGVFWHTQGSGKSYSMVFFSQKILRKLKGNHSVLIVTDRKELDEQIYNTFVGVGAIKPESKSDIWANSGAHLRKMLSEDHRYMFTLVHKFNEQSKEPFPNSEELIVISDEAHRTQYGLLAKNMRDALPNAKFIGFTGTPILSGDEITRQTFGDYISVYDFQRAVEDNATVPLYYESRGEKLGIVNEDLNKEIEEKIDEFDLTDEQEDKLRKSLGKNYHVLTGPDRLDDIAKDIVNHYSTMWKSGKAMLVCLDKITCVKMYNLIDKYWNEKIKEVESKLELSNDEAVDNEELKKLNWLRETEYAVVISEEQNEIKKFRDWDLDIIPHREKIKKGIKRDNSGEMRDIATDFKDSDSPFRLAIVCAMWLTGFDVKSLGILYLDKVLKEHTLMQTIARANRVHEGKENGLIVDYIGIFKKLRQALNSYGKFEKDSNVEVEFPIKVYDELLDELNISIRETEKFLKASKFNLSDLVKCKKDGFKKIELINDACEAIYSNADNKKKYEALGRIVINKYKACLGHEDVNKYTEKFNAIDIIYKRLQKDKEEADISKIMQQIHSIVDESILTEVAGEVSEEENTRYDISNINFDKLKLEFKKESKKNTMVNSMKESLEKRLKEIVKINPSRIDYYNRYQKIIEEYNNEKDRSVIEKTFEDLVDFINDLNKEEKRAAKEGLSEEHLAVFDLLEKEKSKLSSSEREKLKLISRELLKELKKVISDISYWKEKGQTQAKIRTFIRDYLYEELPESYDYEEIDVKENLVFEHFYQNYESIDKNTYLNIS